jgi:hypothetical protein
MFDVTIIHNCVYLVHTRLNCPCNRHVLCYHTGIQYPVHTVFSNVCKSYSGCRWVAFLWHFQLFVYRHCYSQYILSLSRYNSWHVFIQDFSGKSPDFSAKRRIFLQIHRNTPENSKVHPIRCRVRRTETYPILETFLFLITTRRFGGVGAPEGRKKCLTTFSWKLKKRRVSGGRLWNQPNFSAKIVKTRYLTCDFLGDVEG